MPDKQVALTQAQEGVGKLTDNRDKLVIQLAALEDIHATALFDTLIQKEEHMRCFLTQENTKAPHHLATLMQALGKAEQEAQDQKRCHEENNEPRKRNNDNNILV